MQKYKVLGEGQVDVLGTQYEAGSEVELETEAAAPLVEAGTLEVVTEDEGAE